MGNEISFKDRINAFLHPKVEVQKRSSDALKGSFAGFNGMSDSGISVNEESSLKFSAVWLARRILSELPASLPIEIFELKGNNRSSIEHPVKELLLNPNVLMNSFTWTELMNDWLQGWGNGVSVIDNRSGRAQSLMPVHPSSVTPKISNGKLFYTINDRDMGITGTFFSEEILHYKLFTAHGLWGKSPIQMAKENIGLGLAAEKFGAKFFKKGGNIKAAIETEGHMDDTEFAEWKSRWEKFYSGDAGDHETPILEYGMKYKPLGMAPDSLQFLETRQFSIQDVARWFNLPNHMLNDLSKSAFANMEQQDISFVKYNFRALIRRQEVELESKLLLPSEKGKLFIRYNLDGLLRGDLATVTSHIKEMVLSGVYNPDEGRALLNKNPRPGGDVFYTPANIVGNQNIKDNASN
jgi:HK97 family phage portal protein